MAIEVTNTESRTDVLAIASGKGGTGKTLLTACLGYALTFSGHRVLLVDADLSTYGLSLYLLGPNGRAHLKGIARENTWRHFLHGIQSTDAPIRPVRIDRTGGDRPHGLEYAAVVADLGIYGDDPDIQPGLSLARGEFRAAVKAFIDSVRGSNQWDYVVIDTRGGFSYESTDICALADSFVVVTDADFTSFHQNRNLVRLIGEAANEMDVRPLLRGMLVNRATEGEENSFRRELSKEFDIHVEETHPIPLDLEAFKAYRTQDCPYVVARDSYFAYSTLSAFRLLLRLVTAEWSRARTRRWNQLVDEVSAAIGKRNEEVRKRAADEDARLTTNQDLQAEVAGLRQTLEERERELARIDEMHRREIARMDRMLSRSQEKDANRDGILPSMRVRRRKALLVAIAGGLLSVLLLSILLVERSLKRTHLARIDALRARLYEKDLAVELRAAAMRELVDNGVTELRGLNFVGARLQEVDFSGLDLSNSLFVDAALRRAKFGQSRLIGVDLTGADLRGADLRRTNLAESILLNVDIDGDTKLYDTIVNGARVDFEFFLELALSASDKARLAESSDYSLLEAELRWILEGWSGEQLRSELRLGRLIGVEELDPADEKAAYLVRRVRASEGSDSSPDR